MWRIARVPMGCPRLDGRRLALAEPARLLRQHRQYQRRSQSSGRQALCHSTVPGPEPLSPQHSGHAGRCPSGSSRVFRGSWPNNAWGFSPAGPHYPTQCTAAARTRAKAKGAKNAAPATPGRDTEAVAMPARAPPPGVSGDMQNDVGTVQITDKDSNTFTILKDWVSVEARARPRCGQPQKY